MASIILAGVGSIANGGNISGTSIASLGSSLVGTMFEAAFAGNTEINAGEGVRLESFLIQSNTYGRIIPHIYGLSKIAGNIIWADKIKEHKQNITNTHSSKFSSTTYTRTEYYYTISFAIAICNGPLTSLERIWANDVILNKNSEFIRFYKGDENQKPDRLIESIEGIGNTPAYRGLSYIVFENFNITDFGNNIPKLEFEVRKNLISQNSVENMISAINIIPGGGEFVYDTKIQSKIHGELVYDELEGTSKFIQKGGRELINCHNDQNKANAILSIEQLKTTLPNVKWISIVVNWFIDGVDLKCNIMPGIETDHDIKTEPDVWKVSKYSRFSAMKILHDGERPIYGGTINDDSIIRYIKFLKESGYNVMFYPMIFVNQFDKPWRGNIKGKVEDIQDFFNKKTGYNHFILHYANLTKNLVDAFIIGSELKSITSIKDNNNSFPAVNKLINLAHQVKNILGKKTIITYAADWSEYHHCEGGYHHLDDLWSCESIDVIGIDAYFPLTNLQNADYCIENLKKSWFSGEGYDFYYADSQRQQKEKLDFPYAWKNIKWWWENEHFNPGGNKTSWKPKSKKIWFTEYGFPSVDLATNQPNIFFDKKSIDSGFPYYSQGQIDLIAQRVGIQATEQAWENSEIVEKKFLWTWDARPYPFWPDRSDYWSDGESWFRGHWVQGKLGSVSLSALIEDLCKKIGLESKYLDTSKISSTVTGITINNDITLKNVLEYLQKAYFFDVSEFNGKINFIEKNNKNIKHINEYDLIYHNNEHYSYINNSHANSLLNIQTIQENEIPKKVDINFINNNDKYNIGNVHAQRIDSNGKNGLVVNLPIVMNSIVANKLANIMLYNLWTEKLYYNFMLPIKYAFLVPGDIVELKVSEQIHQMRIMNIQIGKNYQIKISAISEDLDLYKEFNRLDFKESEFESNENLTISNTSLYTNVEFIDIPFVSFLQKKYKNIYSDDNFNSNHDLYNKLLIAVCGNEDNWKGALINYQEDSEKKEISCFLDKFIQSTIGNTSSILSEPEFESKMGYLRDNKSSVYVNLIWGQLFSISEEEILLGKNLAIIGEELVQFQYADLIDKNKYKLYGFIRCVFGTNENINHIRHSIGERFILLDENLHSISMQFNTLEEKKVNFNISTLALNGEFIKNDEKSFIHSQRNLKPLPPTHIVLNKLLLSWRFKIYKNYTNINDYQVKISLLYKYKSETKVFYIKGKENYLFQNDDLKDVEYIQIQTFFENIGYSNPIVIKEK